MTGIAIGLIVAPGLIAGCAYLAYPALLWIAGRSRPVAVPVEHRGEWPSLTITVPCYNEARSLGQTLDRLLAMDYPADRRHILVVSDASTDGTDEIVRTYAAQGVELLRLPVRKGKTAAENAAATRIRGELVVNIDATIRPLPGALRLLVAAFQDPTVGVASGRDVSVGSVASGENHGESGYVGYEMWVRALETRAGSIVGASGCFYAIRAELYAADFPEALSRDFASCLLVREQGYRSVSVHAACALVPKTTSLRSEYHRKVRTMARGLGTLWYKRALLNPLRYGRFSLMLASHKLCRWLVPLSLPLCLAGGMLFAATRPACALWIGAALAGLAGVAALAWWWPTGGAMPRWISAPGYLIWSNLAGLAAWTRFLRGRYQPVWEPTRRP
jgi:cellulose synthase/poly-beta-1,6-N-acetylglucosamine synthase-like glycosyltransferase